MIKACVFDLDGTLADTLSSISYYANCALSAFGFSEIEKERYKRLVGDGAKVLIERMLAEVGAPESFYEAVSERYNQTYDEKPLYLTTPYGEVPELLESLLGKGIKLGVLSNKPDPTTKKVVEGLFGKELFHTVMGKRDEFPKKPDPKALLFMLQKMGAEPSECLFVGDSGVDMETANRAGALSVGALWGFRGREELLSHGAKHVIESPLKLLEFLSSFLSF